MKAAAAMAVVALDRFSAQQSSGIRSGCAALRRPLVCWEAANRGVRWPLSRGCRQQAAACAVTWRARSLLSPDSPPWVASSAQVPPFMSEQVAVVSL